MPASTIPSPSWPYGVIPPAFERFLCGEHAGVVAACGDGGYTAADGDGAVSPAGVVLI